MGVRFDGAATILVCKSERDLVRVSKLPRGEQRSWEAAAKIGQTVTASHCLVFEGRAETLSPRLMNQLKNILPRDKHVKLKEIR